jgi:hypothetical protein
MTVHVEKDVVIEVATSEPGTEGHGKQRLEVREAHGYEGHVTLSVPQHGTDISVEDFCLLAEKVVEEFGLPDSSPDLRPVA